MIFQNEEMVCIMSGRRQKANPNIESGWDCVITDRGKYYVSAQWREKQYKKYGVEKTWTSIMLKVHELDNKGR